MIVNPHKEKLKLLLNNLGEALDITEAQFKAVEERYNAVANHLAKEDSLLKDYKPTILPQGSFLLQTMIKPVVETDRLDVDLVCKLSGKKILWTQYDLKQAVGNQIKSDETYREMLDKEGKRCWTLLYAESTRFHMDILPAIESQNYYQLKERAFSALNKQEVEQVAIKITDNTLVNHKTETDPERWPKSNPFAYAAWFKEKAILTTHRTILLSENVKPIPDYVKEKEPLLRVVQILKRHRDIMFGKDENKPISIIITTLAAKAYQKEANIVDALINILSNMASFIEPKYSYAHEKVIQWIGNPTNEEENFADKWPAEPKKEEAFYAWLEKAQEDFQVIKNGDLTGIYRILKATIGTRSVNEAYRATGIDNLISEQYYPVNFSFALLYVPHRELPNWTLNLRYNVEVHGNYKDGKKYKTITPDTTVPKWKDIFFRADTNVPKPYTVYWQVVNTGKEAENEKGLRGGIYSSSTAGTGGLQQKEYSQYTGIHWIECFIVKDGICVARSYEFLINIA